MKNIILKLALYGIIITGFIALKPGEGATISGRIIPVDAGETVWALMGKDSVRTGVGMDGNFQLKVRAGVWKLIVMAKQPYKNYQAEKVEVIEDNNTDVGEIKLQK